MEAVYLGHVADEDNNHSTVVNKGRIAVAGRMVDKNRIAAGHMVDKNHIAAGHMVENRIDK
nr:hypothetical protein [Fictibacillus sp. FJAT-27399]